MLSMSLLSRPLLVYLTSMMVIKTREAVKESRAMMPTMKLFDMSMPEVEEVAWNCSMVGKGSMYGVVVTGIMMERIF